MLVAAGSGSAILGSGCSGDGSVRLATSAKNKNQHEKAVGVAPCLAGPFSSLPYQASVGGALLCQGKDPEALAWLRGR